ncbi:GFA family protein [Henriciella sp. AS95]|uniref:GFA family protein n=1 Tax=Henriciella sp. AS95 TaxID=3135782 RepID=UPI003182911E
MTKTGGCLCGKVRYEIEGEPMFTALCHCTNCQKQGGAAFSVNLLVNEAQLTVEGDLKTFEDKGDSGNNVYRKFCGNCGSPNVSELEAFPGMVAVKGGTLNDASRLNPTVQTYCDSKQDWVSLPESITAFAKSPPAG